MAKHVSITVAFQVPDTSTWDDVAKAAALLHEAAKEIDSLHGSADVVSVDVEPNDDETGIL